MELIRIDLGGVNCYLGKQEDNFILFDTGGHLTMDKSFTDRRELLSSELEKAGCIEGKLKLIVLTHGDNDHVANAAYLRNKFNGKIAMHSEDVKLVDKPSLDIVMRTFQYRSPVFKLVFKFMKKTIVKVTEKVLKNFESFTPDIFLNEGDNLHTYGFEGEIVHLPGHTDGSIGILMSNGDFICGDTFINDKRPAPAPNAFDFRLLSESIEKVKAMKISKIYPGHGAPFEMSLFK